MGSEQNNLKMEIITKYYDNNGKLKILKDKPSKIKSTIRFKISKNKKESPCCDFKGKCTNKSYAEVYPSLLSKTKNKGWSYLCKKHYTEEQKRLKWKLPACLKVEY